MISFKQYYEEKKQAPRGVCWKGYKMVGSKKKKGKEVPNCVPVKENLCHTSNKQDEKS